MGLAGFSDLETSEASNGYVLAELGDRFFQYLVYGPLVILGPGLVEQDFPLVEVVELALHDLFNHLRRLLLLAGLRFEDRPLAIQDILGHILPAKVAGLGSRDV